MQNDDLQQRVEALFAGPERTASALELLSAVRARLSEGSLRIADPAGKDAAGVPQWRVNVWVKQALLLMSSLGAIELRDGVALTGEVDTLPWRTVAPQGCRVPHGSSLRDGSYLAPGVSCLPPTVIQIGSYVDERSTIDSFVNIGIGAQVGKGVQLNCRATVGGWILPMAASPSIVEDDAVLGVGSGVYDGARVGAGAVLLAGTRILPSLGIYDLEHDAMITATPGVPLRVPPLAIVAMGSRAIKTGLMLEVPCIVGRREGSSPSEWKSFTGLRFDAAQ